jgi:hypothetical protein
MNLYAQFPLIASNLETPPAAASLKVIWRPVPLSSAASAKTVNFVPRTADTRVTCECGERQHVPLGYEFVTFGCCQSYVYSRSGSGSFVGYHPDAFNSCGIPPTGVRNARVVFDGGITGRTGPHQTSTLREESTRDSIPGNDAVKNESH